MFYTKLNEATGAMGYFNEDAVAESIYNDFEEGALNAMAENECNYNKLIEAIGIMESVAYEETGEVVYTEGMIGSIWESLKKFVIKVWQKIVGLFKRFMAMFDQYFTKDKEFVKKYRARIMQSDAKDLDFDGYTFKNLDGVVEKMDPEAAADAITNVSSEAIGMRNDADNGEYDQSKEQGDQVTKALDKARGDMCGEASVEASDFHDTLKEKLYGSDSPESLDSIELGEQIRIIENYNDQKKRADKFKTKIDTFFKKLLKEIEDKKNSKAKEHASTVSGVTDRKNSKNDAANKKYDAAESKYSKTTSYLTKVTHGMSAIMSEACGLVLNALKDRNRQARAICVKAMAKSGKFSNESAGFEYPEYGASFLSDIQFK